MTLNFPPYAAWKMARRRIGQAEVYAAVSRGTSTPSRHGRVCYKFESNGRMLVVVLDGSAVVTAFRRRRQPRRR